ncbi:MAG: pyroglutamyl-peptidase I [Candidatus Izemoplasmataceae bacterium]
MRCLITGFEPFLERSENPSMDVLPLLKSEVVGCEIETLLLPVIFDQVFDDVKTMIDTFKPDIVIHLGLAEDRDKIALERVAINIKDARGKDNIGNCPIDETIVIGGQPAYFSSLPLRKFEAVLRQENIPVYLSNTAGTYVCNNVMYHTLHYIAQNNLPIIAGFIHLPLMKEQAKEDEKAMPLQEIKKAISLMIQSVCTKALN